MSDLPLNSVENSLAQTIDANANFTRSPIKLSMTERDVIGGLKQLTELLFKQHFKHNQIGDDSIAHCDDEPLQSDEVSTSIEFNQVTSSDDIRNQTDDTDKENEGNFQKFLDNAMQDGHAEQFCAMVVRQLTSGDSAIDHSDEWHRGQLDAYTNANKHFFERNE